MRVPRSEDEVKQVNRKCEIRNELRARNEYENRDNTSTHAEHVSTLPFSKSTLSSINNTHVTIAFSIQTNPYIHPSVISPRKCSHNSNRSTLTGFPAVSAVNSSSTLAET